jgi:hypothetical protein
MMRLHGNMSGRPRLLLLGMTVAATLAVTLAACSTTSGSGTHATVTPPTTASSAATTPAASSPTATASALSGKWSGMYSGAYQGTFILNWRQSGSNLHGRITLSTHPSTLRINGTVKGDVIRFGTVGSTAITYSGTVSGSSMSGTYQVHSATSSVGGPWSASKSS